MHTDPLVSLTLLLRVNSIEIDPSLKIIFKKKRMLSDTGLSVMAQVAYLASFEKKINVYSL